MLDIARLSPKIELMNDLLDLTYLRVGKKGDRVIYSVDFPKVVRDVRAGFNSGIRGSFSRI